LFPNHEVIMLAYLFVLLAVAVRLLPHPFTFTPVAASLLFFGARGPKRQLWIPLALMVALDLYLTKVHYAYPFTWDHYVTFVWYAAILWLGTGLRRKAGPVRVIAAALASSVSFFLVSNFAFWTTGIMYPRTWEGLTTCFTLAVPYFRQGIEGDLLFTTAMFLTPVVLHHLAGLMHRPADDQAPAI
jgi:hypothetical protein